MLKIEIARLTYYRAEMAVSTHYRHETKEGALDVTINPPAAPYDATRGVPGGATDENSITIQLMFECATTGRFYDASIPHGLLCNICPLFHAAEEIGDTLGEVPTITIDSAMAMAHWIARGKSRTYPVDIVIRRREYPAEERDVVELRAENFGLKKKVAALEERVAALESICTKLVTVVGIKDDHGVISGYDLFNFDYDTIMRAVDRGFDPNNIRGRPELSIGNVGCSDEIPLIFKVVNDHERAGGLIDNRVLLFSQIIMFIKYLLSKGYDPNVTYKGKTVIQTLGHVSDPVHNKPRHAFHKSCIEYCEYCDTLCEMLREAGAK